MDMPAAISPRRRNLALAVVVIAMVLDLLDMTIVNVAIPTLQRDFGATDSEAQWMVAGYATVFAILLITGGRLGDIFGYKRVFITGVCGFTLTSLLCGIAANPDQLVVARLMQGAAAAIMLPQVMSLVQVMYAPHERMTPLGLFGVLGGLAAVLGPVVGGLLIGANLFGLGWRPIFLVNLPIGILAAVAAVYVLPAGQDTRATRLDLTGTLLVTVGLFVLMFPLIQGQKYGWPLWGWAMMACAVPLTMLLVRQSRARMARDGSALIVPALFRDRAFTAGLATTVAFQAAIGGLLFVLTLMLQDGIGLTPAQSGIVHVPYALGVGLGVGVVSRRVLPRFGPVMISWGALVMLAGLIALVGVLQWPEQVAAQPWLTALPLLVMGLGMGGTGGPIGPCTLSEVDLAYAGAASGTLKAVQQFGAAVGIAVIGALFFALVGHVGGRAAVTAFTGVAVAVAVGLIATALLALRIPRRLRILARPDAMIAKAAIGA